MRPEPATENTIGMNSASSKMSRARPLLRQFLIGFALITLLNIIIAIVITYLMHVGRSFLQNLVISMCIGWISDILIDGSRLILWGPKRPPLLPFIGLWIVGIPIAQKSGNALASKIIGVPTERIDAVRSENAVAFIVLTILVCFFISFLFWSRMKLQKLMAEAEAEKSRAAAIERQAMQAQLQLLQAQIEPHMLFNTLANLQGMIAMDPSRAQHMLDQLILYLRATLSSSRADVTTLAHEFSLLEAYLGLMSVRMGARLSYSLQLPDALRQRQVPPMLLQPLIENALKHGLESKIDGGHIEVVARMAGDALTLTVTDTGLGLDPLVPAPKAPGSGVGLANVRERLQALYGERATFSLIPNTPAGVIAQLTIPS